MAILRVAHEACRLVNSGENAPRGVPSLTSSSTRVASRVIRNVHGTGQNTYYAPNALSKSRRTFVPVEIVSVPSRARTQLPHLHRPPTWPALGADDFYMLIQCDHRPAMHLWLSLTFWFSFCRSLRFDTRMRRRRNLHHTRLVRDTRDDWNVGEREMVAGERVVSRSRGRESWGPRVNHPPWRVTSLSQ
ncbi:hypothetical protein EXIGLDRAFT_271461 [Exidia glandulosa HHB12029]|uniref:Uncharacterized protein n=1 Tax=Exidia glandulosa HHB12029 TaxID=1314781 RepID=A0A165DMU0_EXIGL|nr:hypothetical protein EXIGLDRAFT_271461 [Exidia glandulosa HHB12029]